MRKQERIKRVFDFVVASLLLILLFPILLFVTVFLWFNIGRPIFFCQLRPGLRGQSFTIYKFCTMTLATDKQGKALTDEARMTNFGQFLRKYSLDELPELFNVLKGDMSLVGPRPLLVDYLDRYTPEQTRRHDVKPGITGWAQVNGRNSISWEEKFKLDVWYVDHQTFWLDLKILWMTFIKVFKSEGINHAEHSTMPEFMGLEKATTEASIKNLSSGRELL